MDEAILKELLELKMLQVARFSEGGIEYMRVPGGFTIEWDAYATEGVAGSHFLTWEAFTSDPAVRELLPVGRDHL